VLSAFVRATSGWELTLFHAVNRDHGPLVDAVARALGGRLVPSLLMGTLALAAAVRQRRTALWSICAVLLAAAATDASGARLLKPAIARVRPCNALPPGEVRQLLSVSDSAGSLPSLHSANSFAEAAVIGVFAPALACPALLLAAVIAWSRVVVGVHWPSDLWAGGALGAGLGLLICAILGAVRRKLSASNRLP
jgi:undecaprenyl-diphosphatase